MSVFATSIVLTVAYHDEEETASPYCFAIAVVDFAVEIRAANFAVAAVAVGVVFAVAVAALAA